MNIFHDAKEAADFVDLVDGVFEDPAMRMSHASVEKDDYAVGELERLALPGSS